MSGAANAWQTAARGIGHSYHSRSYPAAPGVAWEGMSTDVVDARKTVGERAEPGAIPVLDHGFVRLDGCMADDLSVVNAARVSFAQRSEQLDERDHGLIRFLMRERHGTPFEHNAFRFHVKLPIFVMREWARHRIGSFNEWSARYSQLDAEFYIPEPEDVRTQVGKPGAYSFDPVDSRSPTHPRGPADGLRPGLRRLSSTCWSRAWPRRSRATCCPWRSTPSSTGRSTRAA